MKGGNDELGYKNTHVPIANDSNSGSNSIRSSHGRMATPDVDDVMDIFIYESPANGCAGRVPVYSCGSGTFAPNTYLAM